MHFQYASKAAEINPSKGLYSFLYIYLAAKKDIYVANRLGPTHLQRA